MVNDKEELDLLSVAKYIDESNKDLSTKVELGISPLNDLIKRAEKLCAEKSISIKQTSKIDVQHIVKNKDVVIPTWENLVVKSKQCINYTVNYRDLLTREEIEETYRKLNIIRDDFHNSISANCDKYDYLIAGACGVIGGLIDSFFIGIPGKGKLGHFVDKKTSDVVSKFAETLGWDKEKAINKSSGNLSKSAIGFLENGGNIKEGWIKDFLDSLGFIDSNGKFIGFKVNYDHRHGGDVGRRFSMSPTNHHLKSLGHATSLLGLLISILNQFTSTATFIDKGKIITIHTETFELYGSNYVSKIFSGFVNWIGHLMSDIAGNSGSKTRGSGVPIPFYEVLQAFNFGSFGSHRESIATTAVRVFEDGYDFRHGVTMSIPVLITELITRVMWTFKRRFYHNEPWRNCIPNAKNPNLHRMLFIAYGSFCLIDLTDAAVKSAGVSYIKALLHMNIVAWLRFTKLGLQEIIDLINKDNNVHKHVMNLLDDELMEINSRINETLELMMG